MEIQIRDLQPEDYDALCEIIDEVDTLHREALPRIFRKSEGPVRDKEFILDLIGGGDAGLFVAEADGRMAGFIHVMVHDSPDVAIMKPRRFALVDNLTVKKVYHRQGIGRLLMDYADAWARKNGASSIELNVYAFNDTAVAFYQNLGYEFLSYRMSKSLG